MKSKVNCDWCGGVFERAFSQLKGNKQNNEPNNIRVFASQSEHAHFHAEYNWFINKLIKIEVEGGDAE